MTATNDEVKAFIKMFLEKGKFPLNSYNIISLSTSAGNDGKYLINIETCNPGFLIGAKGKTIAGLTDFLNAKLAAPVGIYVKEFNFWK